MKVGPKYKICKRLGNSVFEKCQTQKFLLSEERSGKRKRSTRPRARSEFGRQLLEKQKIRYTYGLTERQLARYAKEARKQGGGSPAANLYRLLESRLDNTVYRMGLAHTRRQARQLVAHGHVTLCGKKNTVPSSRVREGDAVAVRGGSKEKTVFVAHLDRIREHAAPPWLSFNADSLSGSVVGNPTAEEQELPFDISAVLEFYSK